MEAELESEEPMEMGDDASTSEDDGDWGVVATSVEHHAPMAASTGGGWDTERHNDVPTSKRRAAS